MGFRKDVGANAGSGNGGTIVSEPCTFAQMRSPEFQHWVDELQLPFTPHRKLWEWCWIAQSADAAGLLRAGCRALGFGVGREPLAGLFARSGMSVVATDLAPTDDAAAHWIEGEQHSGDDTNYFGPDVEFRYVDMRAVPDDLRDFDLTWSSCAIEHLGSLDAAVAFLDAQMSCLRVGGIALHTTEFNTSSNRKTLTSGPEVLFRRRDLQALAEHFRGAGHSVQLRFDLGREPEDLHVDEPPYKQDIHLKLRIDRYVSTSFGVAIVRGA